MSNIKKYFSLFIVFMIPAVASAAEITDFKSLIDYVKATLNSLVPLLFAVAVIGFMWGIIKYMYSESPEEITKSRSFMIYGVIAIAVMLSIWGLALMVKNTFFQDSPNSYTPSGQSLQTGPSYQTGNNVRTFNTQSFNGPGVQDPLQSFNVQSGSNSSGGSGVDNRSLWQKFLNLFGL